MKNSKKWTHSMRIFLYETLYLRFGEYSEWEGKYYPGGKKEEFRQCLADLAAYFSKRCGLEFSAEAVELQLKWATTDQEKIIKNHMITFIKNKAAAHEVGFIQTSNCPSLVLAE